MRRKNKTICNGGNKLRIIGGEWKGRKLPIADVKGLRPTPDRVRETVFNWLAPYIMGARILDCFSGSGALSIESLSRGASSAVMVEKNPYVAQILNKNIALLSLNQVAVINIDSLVLLSTAAKKSFDVIFLDPPFRQDLVEPVCRLLHANGYVSSNTLVYIESEKELLLTMLPKTWSCLKEKVAGQMRYSLWNITTL